MGVLYEYLNEEFDSIEQTILELLNEDDDYRLRAACRKLDKDELLVLANNIIQLAAKVTEFEHDKS